MTETLSAKPAVTYETFIDCSSEIGQFMDEQVDVFAKLCEYLNDVELAKEYMNQES